MGKWVQAPPCRRFRRARPWPWRNPRLPCEAARRRRTDGKPIRHLYLVDGSGYMFRAYHALPPMTRPTARRSTPCYGFCRMLCKLLDDPEVDHIAMIFDAGAHDLPQRDLRQVQGQPAGAAGRPDPAVPADPRGRQGVRRARVRARRLRGRRPDRDLCPHGASRPGGTCTIVSSDKDLMQLDPRPASTMLDPIKQKPHRAPRR